MAQIAFKDYATRTSSNSGGAGGEVSRAGERVEGEAD